MHLQIPPADAVPAAVAAPAATDGGGPDLPASTEAVRRALGLALEEKIGLILVAGPQGSGRGDTLRALAACRPDAEVAGELVSRETAEEALVAARRRLVLATMDSRDAIGAIGRLAAMRLDPFAIAFALRLVLAQRRVRRLCQSCREPVQPGNAVTAPLGLDPGGVVYQAPGCSECGGSGSAAPAAAFETLPVDATIGRLIVCGAEEAAIAGHAFRSWPNLAATARTLAMTGQIDAEEALRLLRGAQRQ
ncbi:MAG TPA: ATPase, T2SS/T4P/T4SS family [Allosphingosinicella sp.]|nr:ATPase, T2SS/T4P/T4SS family [Allosphingosinicella sp.]